MPIRKIINQKGQHNKSANALQKAGMSGIIISTLNDEIVVTMFGEKKNAFAAIQNALTNVPYLKAAAQFVTGPKVTLMDPKTMTEEELNKNLQALEGKMGSIDRPLTQAEFEAKLNAGEIATSGYVHTGDTEETDVVLTTASDEQ